MKFENANSSPQNKLAKMQKLVYTQTFMFIPKQKQFFKHIPNEVALLLSFSHRCCNKLTLRGTNTIVQCLVQGNIMILIEKLDKIIF